MTGGVSMHGISALSISSAFYSCVSSTSAAAIIISGPGGLLVYAHCHPFNGRDLPIFGVLQKIIIEQQLADYPPLQGLAEAYAFFLANLIFHNAPDYKSEKKILQGLIKNPNAVRKLKRNPVTPDSDEEFFTSGINKFIEEHTSFDGAQELTQNNDELIFV